MTYMPTILALAGSARRGSFNHALVSAAAVGARNEGAVVTLLDMNDYQLPLFNQDVESAEGLPENARRLKRLFVEHDGLLISSPEYNGGITPLLKNTIDWVSRKEGDEPALVAYRGKLAVVMAASPGALGGIRALPQVATILSGIGVTVLPNRLALGKAEEVFAADGSVKDEKQRKTIEALGAALAKMLAKLNR